MDTVIVENLTKRFGDFTAVDSVSFSVAKGEIFGLLGPNGAGKSTTIKMLCGLLRPDQGKGTVGGFDIIAQQWEIKTIIGYMSQKFSLYEDLTIEENLEFYGTVYGLKNKKLKQRMDVIYELVNIKGLKNTLVKTLPLGIKQRLALGSALIHDPQILFLDEPTSGVDPLMRRIFWDEIYTLAKEGKTIFVTTHYMDEAEHCNRIALIIAGKIIALDTPQSLKENLPYTIVKITTQSYLKAYNVLNKADFVIEVALFGADLHVVLAKKFKNFSMIKNLLRSHNIHDVTLEPILPTLEDVFVMSAR
ncbi:MAG: ABC transporter ATP-binding protein [Spirochaetes bacterium]|nr:ABC transporter ATP-binding protein [Spirochaetota bacterium]